MKTLKTITGREIKISSNKAKRTWTLITDAAKFRTNRMSKEEFSNCDFNTGNDWQNFLDSSTDYYIVK